MHKRLGRFLLWSVVFCAAATAAAAQVYQVRELNTEQIRALDRERTVVILPGGILEQHGPYLPSYSDGYMNQRLTRDLADAVVAQPGWKALVFPVIPLGAHGANIIGRKYSFPGNYTVRADTLRAIFMDLGDELGEQGFRWVFLVHLHGGPEHNRALDQAGDYFRDTHGGHMVHLTGLMPVFAALDGTRTPQQEAEEGFTVHSGLEEHSVNLFLRPDRVHPGYRKAPVVKAENPAQLVARAKEDGWPGYFGSPRLASAAQGAEIWRRFSGAAVETALRILQGADPRQMPRYYDLISQVPEIGSVNRDALQHDRQRAARQAQWLRKRPRKVFTACELLKNAEKLTEQVIAVRGWLATDDSDEDEPVFDKLLVQNCGANQKNAVILIVPAEAAFLENPPLGFKPDVKATARAAEAIRLAQARGRIERILATVEGYFEVITSHEDEVSDRPPQHETYLAHIVLQTLRDVEVHQ